MARGKIPTCYSPDPAMTLGCCDIMMTTNPNGTVDRDLLIPPLPQAAEVGEIITPTSKACGHGVPLRMQGVTLVTGSTEIQLPPEKQQDKPAPIGASSKRYVFNLKAKLEIINCTTCAGEHSF